MSTSTLLEIMAAAPVKFTTADLAEWNLIALPTAMALEITTDSLPFTIKVGTFGFDLTTINTNCKAAYTASGVELCQSERIDAYDGFAVGMYLTTNTPALAYSMAAGGGSGSGAATMYATAHPIYLCFENETCIGVDFANGTAVVEAEVGCTTADGKPATTTTTFITNSGS
jgi:hypothetical protein